MGHQVRFGSFVSVSICLCTFSHKAEHCYAKLAPTDAELLTCVLLVSVSGRSDGSLDSVLGPPVQRAKEALAYVLKVIVSAVLLPMFSCKK